MWELKGPAFERVLAYGQQKAEAEEIEEKVRPLFIRAHVRAWASSVLLTPRQTNAFPMVNIEWIEEQGALVGVRAYV
jgi:hypothetical protein